ncbi:PEP-CTERM sorting domain-containing protein [Colwellia sp. Arc7-635]|jgi:hypothetical protein|uniref:PEP-CTERM sorting domain-containing protein n=1 Tax=Colwellia sp. Arc7-635 TaxID=2497879 RepID=UPI000F85692F|nr:PEP-CTERM sorting domain-containing protein [Colwellia sp. Arc7-635]AZQ83630.1 PEP-CTERM sorting domain-containing protein [Colwellia sp. Arc7-635]
MKFKFLNKALTGLVFSAGCLVSVANAGIIYSNDFESGSTAAQFTVSNSVVTAPNGESYIGPLNKGETPTLSLDNLATHSSITIDFDIYGLRSLDGTTNQDYFQFFIDGSSQFIDFYGHSNGQIVGPTTGQLVSHESTAFGHGYFYGGASTYHYSITYTHVASSINFGFKASTDQSWSDEAFGLDNVVVSDNRTLSAATSVPEPSTLAIFALAIMGFASRKFKKQS